MMVTRRPASTFTVEVMFHPDPDVEYVAGRAIRPSHPLVAAMLSSEIPPNHTDVDTLLRDPASHPLPSWHPRLEAMLRRSASAKATLPEVMVALDHPDADAEYRAGNPISLTHPSVQELMKGHLPPDHPDCDTLLRDPAAHPLPAWHPRLNDMMAHRSLWSPGLIFSMLCFATLLLAIMIRAGAKCSSKVYKRLHRADLNRNEVVHRVPVQIKKRSARSYEDGGESAASSPEFDDTEVRGHSAVAGAACFAMSNPCDSSVAVIECLLKRPYSLRRVPRIEPAQLSEHLSCSKNRIATYCGAADSPEPPLTAILHGARSSPRCRCETSS